AHARSEQSEQAHEKQSLPVVGRNRLGGLHSSAAHPAESIATKCGAGDLVAGGFFIRSSTRETRYSSASSRAYPAATPSFPPATMDSTPAAKYKPGSAHRAASAVLPCACRSC